MENATGIMGGLVIGGIFAYFVFARKLESKKSETKNEADPSFLLLQQQMSELARALDSKLTESRRDMQDAVRVQFTESQKLLKDINEQMSRSLVDVAREQTKTNEATRQFITIAEK